MKMAHSIKCISMEISRLQPKRTLLSRCMMNSQQPSHLYHLHDVCHPFLKINFTGFVHIYLIQCRRRNPVFREIHKLFDENYTCWMVSFRTQTLPMLVWMKCLACRIPVTSLSVPMFLYLISEFFSMKCYRAMETHCRSKCSSIPTTVSAILWDYWFELRSA